MTISDSDGRAIANAAGKAREWTRRRDELIRAQLKVGVTLRALGEWSGLSHTAISKIGKRKEKKP